MNLGMISPNDLEELLASRPAAVEAQFLGRDF